MKHLSAFLLVGLVAMSACGITSTTTTTVVGPDGVGTSTLGESPDPGSADTTGDTSHDPPVTTVPEGHQAAPVRETFPDLGRDHLSDADAVAVINGTMPGPDYNSQPPTSGIHTPVWAQCGIYKQEIPGAVQVHSLEHGAVIIQYHPEFDPDGVLAIEEFARAKGSHIVVAPNDALPAPIVLTAWTVREQLQVADVDAMDAFWVEFANEGPERVACPIEIDEAAAVSA